MRSWSYRERAKATTVKITSACSSQTIPNRATCEAVAPVYAKHAATIGQDVVDAMMAALKTMRGQ